MRWRRNFLRAAAVAWAVSWAGALQAGEPAAVVWRVADVARVGGNATEIIGAPRVVDGAVRFDGVKDGLLVAANPLEGAREFTVEILFRPEEGGPAEQRFWHVQDGGMSRALIETRLDGKGAWWLDTFLLKAGTAGRALIDAQRTHPTGRWYWVALRYDGKTMTSFVNGVKELAGEVEFGPMSAGKVSLGVRQNRVHWFKGAIREVRFTPAALAEGTLQRVRE